MSRVLVIDDSPMLVELTVRALSAAGYHATGATDLASLEVKLEPSQSARLDDATQIDPGFPHQFLASDMMKKFLSGGDPSQLR